MKIKFLMFLAVILAALFFSAEMAVADSEDSGDLNQIFVDQNYINQYLDADNPSEFEDMDGHYVLEENIDLTGRVWKPIGSDSAFSGTFDGAGWIIYDFNYDGSDQSSGFFKSVNGASVSNLTFFNPVVTATDANGAGILIGTATGATTIENCTVINGNVNITGTDGENAGGLIGLLEGDTSYIHKSDFKGNVENAGKASGGLVGSAENLIITESSATGSINTDGEYAGGLIGFVTENGGVSVSDSYFEGDIKAGNQASGLIGYVSLNPEIRVFDSYSVALISVPDVGKSNGLIGKRNDENEGIEVTNSFYLGMIDEETDNGLGIPVTGEELKKYETFTGLEDEGGYIRGTPWDISSEKELSIIWYVAEDEDYPRFSRNSAGSVILPGVDIPRLDLPEVSEPVSSGSSGSAKVVESFSSEDAEEFFKPPFALDLNMEPLSYKALYLILIVGFILIVAGVSRRLDRKD